MANVYLEVEALNEEIINCRKCPRLVEWRERVARTKRKAYEEWEYWGKPVPGFGDPKGRILVVGLAPGAHGSNRTGRQFTGDASGDFLYPALHRAGFANQSTSRRKADGLRLDDLYLTASVRCAPPDNKPALIELKNCQTYLEREIRLIQPRVIVCLGRIAFDRVLRILMGMTKDDRRTVSATRRTKDLAFQHGAAYHLAGGTWLLASYHPSQQNTLTGRLTQKMFDRIWIQARSLLEKD